MAEPLPDTIFQPPGMVGATAGQEAAAGALDIGVGAAQNVSEIINNHLADRAQITGKLAGAEAGSRIDPNTGELLPIESLPPLNDTSIYSQAYRDAALQTYANTAITQAQANAEVYAQQNPADPAGFGTQWNAYIQKTIGKAQPLAVGLIQPALVNIGTRYAGELTRQNVEIMQKDHAAALNTANQVTQNTTQAQLKLLTNQPGASLSPSFLLDQENKAAQTINQEMAGWQHNMDAAKQAFPQIWTKSAVEEARRTKLKTLWNSYFQQQAQSFADQEVRVGGAYKPDEAGAASYLQNPDVMGQQDPTKSPIEAGLFSQDEWNKIQTDGMAAFQREANTQAQRMANDTDRANAEYTTQFTGMKNQADQLFAVAKASNDPTALKAYIDSIKQQNPTLAMADDQSAARLGELESTWTKWTDYQSEMGKINLNNILNSANNSDVNNAHPYTIPGGPGKKEAIARQQMYYDSLSANPDKQMHAYDDPQEFARLALDDNHGWVYHGATMLPKVGNEFETYGPQGGADGAAKNQHILENYDAMMRDPVAAKLVSDQATMNMEALRASLATPDPLGTYTKLITAGTNEHAAFEDHFAQAAQEQAVKYKNDPSLVTKDLEAAGNHAISDSSFFPTLWREVWGLPNLKDASAMPDNFKPGAFSAILSGLGMTDDMKQKFGIPPSGDVNIVTDDKADKAFAANVVYNKQHGSGDGEAQNKAFGQMGDADFGLSRLLFSDKLLDIDKTTKAKLQGSYVYGYGSPEKEMGLPSYTIAQRVSMDLADHVGQMFKDQGPDQLGAKGWFVSRVAPPGSPDFLYGQFTNGNLRLEPHLVNDRMEYDVYLRAQTPGGDQYIQINPKGQYWHYDMSSTGDDATNLQAAQVGGRLANRVSDYFGNTAVGRVAGQAAGSLAAWKVESDATEKKFDDARSAYITRRFSAPSQ